MWLHARKSRSVLRRLNQLWTSTCTSPELRPHSCWFERGYVTLLTVSHNQHVKDQTSLTSVLWEHTTRHCSFPLYRSSVIRIMCLWMPTSSWWYPHYQICRWFSFVSLLSCDGSEHSPVVDDFINWCKAAMDNQAVELVPEHCDWQQMHRLMLCVKKQQLVSVCTCRFYENVLFLFIFMTCTWRKPEQSWLIHPCGVNSGCYHQDTDII